MITYKDYKFRLWKLRNGTQTDLELTKVILKQ